MNFPAGWAKAAPRQLERPDQPRRDQHHQFCLCCAAALLLKEVPTMGIRLRNGDGRPILLRLVVEQSGDGKRLAVSELDFGIRPPCGQRRNPEPDRVMPLLKSSVLTSGLTWSLMTSPAIVGLKVKTDAELLEVDRDHPGRPLHQRHRELAAGKEARLLAVVGDEVRLGEALEVPGSLEGANDGADVVPRVEHEEVQEVRLNVICRQNPRPAPFTAVR